MEVIFTDHFLKRVEECTDYIALDHVPTAVNWARQVFDHCEKLTRIIYELVCGNDLKF